MEEIQSANEENDSKISEQLDCQMELQNKLDYNIALTDSSQEYEPIRDDMAFPTAPPNLRQITLDDLIHFALGGNGDVDQFSHSWH